VQHGGIALDVHFDAALAVEHPARELALARQPIDERAKTDALNDAAHVQPARFFNVADLHNTPALRNPLARCDRSRSIRAPYARRRRTPSSARTLRHRSRRRTRRTPCAASATPHATAL